MKKLTALLLLAALILTLAGCKSGPGIIADPAGTQAGSGLPAATDPHAVPSETTLTVETPTELPGGSDTPTEPGETAGADATYPPVPLDEYTVYTLTREYTAEDGTYTVTFEDWEQTYGYSYHLPELTPDTEGARSINAKIKARFDATVNEALKAIEDGIGTPLVEVYWHLDFWNNIISVIVYDSYDWGSIEYEIYYYDTESGTELTSGEMLERLVITEDEFLEAVREAVYERYDSQYEEISESDRESYGVNTMRAMIDGDEIINMELVKFYVSPDGSITVVAPVPSIAGASYYYQVLYPTIRRG